MHVQIFGQSHAVAKKHLHFAMNAYFNKSKVSLTLTKIDQIFG